VSHAVDELALMTIDAGDDLRRDDLRFDPILALDAHVRHDRIDRGLDLALVHAVQLEHPVRALDDLHPRPARGGLERRVGQLVDRDARGDLDEERCFLLEWHETRAHGLKESGELRL
jgi:hypothetical protein